MKIKLGMFVLLITAAFVVVGCGSDSKKDEPKTKESKAAQEIFKTKTKAVNDAKKNFEDNKNDANACRDYGMKLTSLASPQSTGDPKKPAKNPKDHKKNKEKAVEIYEQCVKIDPNDRHIKRSLASAYNQVENYEKSEPLLRELAKSSKGAEQANDYYGWFLTANRMGNTTASLEAARQFVKVAPAKDSRVATVRDNIKDMEEAANKQKADSAKKSNNDKEEGGEE